MDAAQQQEISNPSLSKRKNSLIIGGLILAAVIIYAFFWINFFGISKSTQSPTPQKITSPYQKQFDQLDSVSNSIKAIQQPLDPKSTQENFAELKASIDRRAQTAKEALTRGDTEAARKALGELRAAIREMGDPLKANFIPKSIRDQYDPQEVVLKRTDRIDPEVRDLYLTAVAVELIL